MATINELTRERKKVASALRRELRDIKAKLEKSDRFLTRMISRRTKIPDQSDLMTLVDLYSEAAREFDEYLKMLEDGQVVFRSV